MMRNRSSFLCTFRYHRTQINLKAYFREVRPYASSSSVCRVGLLET